MRERWLISATIKTLSPLHIGSGLVAEHQDPESKEISTVSLIERDWQDAPFIPATAIKGLLRNRAAHCQSIDVNMVERLFGGFSMKRGGGQAETAIGGSAEFQNCWFQGEPSFQRITRTAIAAGTGTKKDGHLFTEEWLLPESQFDFEIIVDRAEQEDVEALLGLIATIDGGDPGSSIGAGTGQGLGRIAVTDVEVKRFGPDEAKTWMQGSKTWRECAREDNLTPLATQLALDTVVFDLVLPIDGLFMTSVAQADAEQAPRTPLKLGKKGHAVLLGSGVDGPFFHQAARIWRTMKEDYELWTPDTLPAPLAELFGSTNQAGLLGFSIFEDPASGEPVRQEHVAIDRFHGGAADGAKFSEEAYEAPNLAGKMTLAFSRLDLTSEDLQRKAGKRTSEKAVTLSPEALGLLVLTLWDLHEGDITFGFGTRKGYGQPRAIDLDNLLRKLGQAALRHIKGVAGKSEQEIIADAIAALREIPFKTARSASVGMEAVS